MPGRCSMPSAVLALPCGSRSMTSVRSPCSASAAATLTAVVVLPTPPFWLAIVKTRCRAGRGSPPLSAACSRRTARSASAPIGVSSRRRRRSTIPAESRGPMFHVKHPRVRLPRIGGSAGRRYAVRRPELILFSCPFADVRLASRAVASAPRDDHGRGWIQVVRATSHHPYIDRAQATPSHAGARRISSSARSPLMASIRPSGRSSGMLHFGQLVQGRHRPGDNRVHLPHLLSHRPILGPSPNDRDVRRRVRRPPRAGTRCGAEAVR